LQYLISLPSPAPDVDILVANLGGHKQIEAIDIVRLSYPSTSNERDFEDQL
jgi:hypothetical protein